MKLLINKTDIKSIEDALKKIEKIVQDNKKEFANGLTFELIDENSNKIKNLGEILIKSDFENRLVKLLILVTKYAKIAEKEEDKFLLDVMNSYSDVEISEDLVNYSLFEEEEEFVLYLLKDLVIHDKKYLPMFKNFAMTVYADYGDYQDQILLDIANATDLDPILYPVFAKFSNEMVNGRLIDENLVNILNKNNIKDRFLNDIYEMMEYGEPDEAIATLRDSISYIENGGNFIFKSYKEMFEVKQKHPKLRILQKDLQKLFPNNILELKGEEMAHLLSILDFNYNEGHQFFFEYDLEPIVDGLVNEEKINLSESLINHLHLIDINTVFRLFNLFEYKNSKKLLYSFMDNENYNDALKIQLFDNIFKSDIPRDNMKTFIPLVVESIKNRLLDKNCDRFTLYKASDLLKKIAKRYDDQKHLFEIYDNYYKNSELWSHIYEEENKENSQEKKSYLFENLARRADDALEDENYERVVNILSRRENELPQELLEKLNYARKMIEENN